MEETGQVSADFDGIRSDELVDALEFFAPLLWKCFEITFFPKIPNRLCEVVFGVGFGRARDFSGVERSADHQTGCAVGVLDGVGEEV